MKHSANHLCPACGEQIELEPIAAGIEWIAGCPCCPLPAMMGPTQCEAVDRFVDRAERAVMRGAA